jgi:hypothetical protein
MDIEINVGKEKEDMEDMAEKGENGDSVMGHLTPGEVVLPVALVQKLAEPLKKAFEAANLDMDQYTVGHEKNSINEESGCPEFAGPPPDRFSGSAYQQAMFAGSPQIASDIAKGQEEARQDRQSQEELAAAQAELDKLLAEQDALQKQVQSEMASGQAQIARTRQETEMTQRETGERRLARLRARVRSLSRPMLSKGVSL